MVEQLRRRMYRRQRQRQSRRQGCYFTLVWLIVSTLSFRVYRQQHRLARNGLQSRDIDANHQLRYPESEIRETQPPEKVPWSSDSSEGIVYPTYVVARGDAPSDSGKKTVKMNPFKSSLPPKIPLIRSTASSASESYRGSDLDPMHTQMLRRRHACIQKARDRQYETFHQYLDTAQQYLLVDPAYHKNVGDHMLTLGELTLLRRYAGVNESQHGGGNIKQCDYVQSEGWAPKCDELLSGGGESGLSPNTLALWHAGGNWGDLWPTAQEARTQSLPDLIRHPSISQIISMPQSLFFQDAAEEERNRQELREKIAKAYEVSDKNVLSTLLLTWREQESYDRAKQLYPFAKHAVVPDLAFQLGPYAPQPPIDSRRIFDFVIFLRNDHESTVASQRQRTTVRNMLTNITGDPSTLTFTLVDWEDRLHQFDSNDYYFTNTSIQLLSQGRVLVCDRLHAAILAYLTGLPFVYVDQVSGKINKTLSVVSNDDNCRNGDVLMFAAATDLPEALRLAVGFLHKYGLRDDQAKSRAERRKELLQNLRGNGKRRELSPNWTRLAGWDDSRHKQRLLS